jgi:hypothetical protein
MALPDWLQAPAQRALRDLQGDEPILISVAYDGEYLVVREKGTSTSTGIWVDERRGEELTVHIADELVEQVFPETEQAWGQARPRCPGHPHPASAELLDGEAWWRCPRDGRRIAPIGRYPATASQRA